MRSPANEKEETGKIGMQTVPSTHVRVRALTGCCAFCKLWRTAPILQECAENAAQLPFLDTSEKSHAPRKGRLNEGYGGTGTDVFVAKVSQKL